MVVQDVTGNKLNPSRTRSYPRGYTLPSALRGDVAAAHSTSLSRTALTAFLDLGLLLLSSVGASLLVSHMPLWAAWIIALLAAVFVGQQLRALECLLHEASHLNWYRKHRSINDLAAIILTGLPTALRPGWYRESHLVHHGKFGTEADPDYQKYQDLTFEDIRRDSIRSFGRDMGARFADYEKVTIQAIRQRPLPAITACLWAACLIVGPAWLLGGATASWAAAAIWVVAFWVVWSAIRFIGECGEHEYRRTGTVFEASVNGLGFTQRLIFHPHGDGYHTVHHMWPGVPHHQLGHLHRLLLRRDPQYAARLRFRLGVLDSVRTGYTSQRANEN